MSRNFKVYEKRDSPYSVILDSRLYEEALLFESSAIAELSPPEVEELRKGYTKLLDAHGCLGVLKLSQGESPALLYLVVVTNCVSVGKITDSEIFRVTGVTILSLQGSGTEDDRVSGVQKLFNSGTFYFATSIGDANFNITLCSQRRKQDHETDNRFFWNRSMHIQFERFGIDCQRWVLKVICGGIEIRTIYSGHKQAKACLISRLSCERAGTRFNTRGTNDDGQVANFVETEQVIFLDDVISSYVQIRGSVPLFWEQPGLNVGSHKIKISRGYEACAPALERHISGLRKHYGEISLLDLLGRKEGEHLLSEMYKNHLEASHGCKGVPYVYFDYHSECRNGSTKNLSKLESKVVDELKNYDIFHFDGSKVVRQQSGCFRTNCVDCLDRTNAVQTFIGLKVLHTQLESLGLVEKPQMVSRFTEIYKQIWPINGDHISRIYAGTSAMTVGKSKYRDVTTSATRAIQNNFLDNSKQDAINLLLLGGTRRTNLGDIAHSLNITSTMHSPASLVKELVLKHEEYTTPEKLRICLSTWNVNGGTHFRSIAFRHQSLNDWLLDMYENSLRDAPETCDTSGDSTIPIDIFAIGFEEIVDLTAKNITSASTSNQKAWGAELQKTISRDNKFVLVTSAQLVGVCLFVFARPHLAPFIRDVSVDSVKTGLGGAAGNKGAVAIRFLLHSSSMCFVCAHFAAGQSNLRERNDDYTEICNKLSFPLGGTLRSHDYIFWVGDFNYRIDLPKNECEMYIKDGNWVTLQAADQLSSQRSEGNVFQGFNEGALNFAPTYKYDVFCNDYDTSEKARVPSWTDRCLWKRSKLLGTNEENWNKGKLLVYNRAELKTSDHRPVAAVIDVDVLKVDTKLRERVQELVVNIQGPTDGTVLVSPATEGDDLSDEVEHLLDIFGETGDIILVRFVLHDIFFTYSCGKAALEAVRRFDSSTMCGHEVNVTLRKPTWADNVRNELNMCTSSMENTFFSSTTNSLLGEEFTLRSMSFDAEGGKSPLAEDEDDDNAEIMNMLCVESLHPSSSTTSLSSSSTPIHSGRSTPVNIEQTDKKPGPPARPSKPPTRPPPPKKPTQDSDLLTSSTNDNLPEPSLQAIKPARPSVPKVASNVTDSDETIKPSSKANPILEIGSPELIAHSTAPIERVVMRQKNTASSTTGKRVPSVIGIPQNVTHAGAKTEEDAKKLIENLMGKSIESTDLPPPLKPTDKQAEQSAGLASQKPMTSSTTKVDEHQASEMRTPPMRPVAPDFTFSITNSYTESKPVDTKTSKIILGLDALTMGSKQRNEPQQNSEFSNKQEKKTPPPIPQRSVFEGIQPIPLSVPTRTPAEDIPHDKQTHPQVPERKNIHSIKRNKPTPFINPAMIQETNLIQPSQLIQSTETVTGDTTSPVKEPEDDCKRQPPVPPRKDLEQKSTASSTDKPKPANRPEIPIRKQLPCGDNFETSSPIVRVPPEIPIRKLMSDQKKLPPEIPIRASLMKKDSTEST